MRGTAENRMSSHSLCFFRHSLVSITLVLVFLLLFGSLNTVLSSILITCSLFIFSTVLLFTFSKQKQTLKENPSTDKVHSSGQKNQPEMEPEIESCTQKNDTQEGEVGQVQKCVTRSPDLLSETESADHSSTSEDSDGEWLFPVDVGQTPSCSDGSISDEESLIEIVLPDGHYVPPEEEEEEMKLQSRPNLPDFLTKSMFQQEGLMEFLAEINDMNDEENLIEIDISMGSIKCSRLEIEA